MSAMRTALQAHCKSHVPGLTKVLHQAERVLLHFNHVLFKENA
jgi:hypothetical protein